MAQRTCSIEGCQKPVRTRGMCNAHYTREFKAGRLPPLRRPTIEDRFWAKVDRSAGPDGCWPWTRCLGAGGYGSFRGPTGTVNAHRWIYKRLVDPTLSDDLTLDHLCHTWDTTCPGGDDCTHRACVNPSHLEPVTNAVNSKRGNWGRKTHCPQGHPYDDANTLIRRNGNRVCRTCRKAQQRSSYLKRKAVRS